MNKFNRRLIAVLTVVCVAGKRHQTTECRLAVEHKPTIY